MVDDQLGNTFSQVMRIILSLASCLWAACAVALPSNAAAQALEPVVQQNIPVIAEHLARGGATQVPGVECGATCAELWAQEHRPIAGQPSSEALHRELRTARSSTAKVLPRLRYLTPVALTGMVAWKVGTDIRTKLLKIGLPDPPSRKTNPASGTLRFQPAGWSNSTNTTPLPADGWVLHWWHGSSEWSAVNLAYGWGDDCAYLTGPPADFRVLSGTASIGWCNPPPVPTERYWLKEGELRAAAPIEDYVDQPYDKQLLNWSDKPQSKLQLEDRTRTALESGEYRLPEPWYAHQLDPQTYEDPTEEEQERDACRPADAVPSGDPAPHRGTEDFMEDPIRWRMRYDTVPEVEFPPGSAVPEVGLVATGDTADRAYMRWGWTALNAKEAIDWQGWGYRKIVAKHGWSATALARTKQALLTAPIRDRNHDLYVGPPYPSRTGALGACQWVVSVQREPLEDAGRPELSEGVPMGGIISAHGAYATPG